MSALRVASFTVHATAHQSARWKQAAEAEGFTSAGQWLACAADAYLRVRAKAGVPLPLAWHRGRFLVRLESGEELMVRGHVSHPFGIYRGTTAAPRERGLHAVYTLVHILGLRTLATMALRRECQALAADLARTWVREEGHVLP